MMSELKKDLDVIREVVESLKDIILSNAISIGEIPSPTFGETAAIKRLEDFFMQEDVKDVSCDEAGNIQGTIPGKVGARNIALVAHADTAFEEGVDHTLSLRDQRIFGPGIADNSLGLSVLASVPTILQKLNRPLNANLVLVGVTRSLGRGDLGGIRFFLENNKVPIDAGICIEGVELGRLNYSALSMMRGELTCTVPEEYDWDRLGASSAIIGLNEVINRAMELPLPRRPATTIVMGAIKGGNSYHKRATEAALKFELRSASNEIVSEASERVRQIVKEVEIVTRDHFELDIFASRNAGGIPIGHPLVRSAREVMDVLGISVHDGPSMSELAAFIDRGIPAITIGVTHGENTSRIDGSVSIEGIYTGLTQLMGILFANDAGGDDGEY